MSVPADDTPDPAQRVRVSCPYCEDTIPAAGVSMVAWELGRHLAEACSQVRR